MKQLKKINPAYYMYLDKDTGILFELSNGNYGVLGYGEAYYLTAAYHGEKSYIATFCVKDDSYGRYLQAYGKKIWQDMNEILKFSNNMIKAMLE